MTKLQKVQQRLGVWNHTKLPEGTRRKDRIGRGTIDRFAVESKEDRSDMDETKEDDEPKENSNSNNRFLYFFGGSLYDCT